MDPESDDYLLTVAVLFITYCVSLNNQLGGVLLVSNAAC